MLLTRGRELIKGKQFQSWRSVGVALQAARVHAMRGVDELMILDIGATPEDREPDYALIEELSEACFCPLTCGGGVTMLSQVKNMLRAGADKVLIGTAARTPFMIPNVARHCGSQAVVVSLDVSDNRVITNCGTKPVQFFPMPHDVVRTAKWMETQGAGEILLTSIDREGTMEGYDLDLITRVSKAVSIPVIANGGCGTYHDMLQAIQAGAHAVAAGAMFQFSDATPAGAADYLAAHGVTVRQKEKTQ